MNAKAIAKFVYGFFGAVFLPVGSTVLLLHTGLLPEAVKNIVMNFAHGDMLGSMEARVPLSQTPDDQHNPIHCILVDWPAPERF